MKKKSKSLKLVACNDWIILLRKKNSKETSIGMITVVEDRTQYEGSVMAVGPDVDIGLEPGDTVIWGKWEGTPLFFDGIEYTGIRCSDAILAGRVR